MRKREWETSKEENFKLQSENERPLGWRTNVTSETENRDDELRRLICRLRKSRFFAPRVPMMRLLPVELQLWVRHPLRLKHLRRKWSARFSLIMSHQLVEMERVQRKVLPLARDRICRRLTLCPFQFPRLPLSSKVRCSWFLTSNPSNVDYWSSVFILVKTKCQKSTFNQHFCSFLEAWPFALSFWIAYNLWWSESRF